MVMVHKQNRNSVENFLKYLWTYYHMALDVIPDCPPPSLITSACMNHEIALSDFVTVSSEVFRLYVFDL